MQNPIKKFTEAYHLTRGKLDNMNLNKKGTVGTEPIGKVQPDGSLKRYTEVKLGKLGKFDIPNKRAGMY